MNGDVRHPIVQKLIPVFSKLAVGHRIQCQRFNLQRLLPLGLILK